jgi:hypothetical protein
LESLGETAELSLSLLFLLVQELVEYTEEIKEEFLISGIERSTKQSLVSSNKSALNCQYFQQKRYIFW